MPTRRAFCLVFLLALWPGMSVLAQQIDPSKILRGYLRYVGQSAVTLGGNPAQLAPGALIRGQNNLIVLPTSLPAQGAWVDYVVDQNGQIYRAWLLSADEVSRPPRPRAR